MSEESTIEVFLGLGSNVGNRVKYLNSAIEALHHINEIDMVARSKLYVTPPWGYTEQRAFVNAVVKVTTSLTPQKLLETIKNTERKIGRTTREKWGSREIDIDILLYGEARVENPDLHIPHEHLGTRAFVLVPLLELAPDLMHPGKGIALSTLLEGLPEKTKIHEWKPPEFEMLSNTEEETVRLGRVIGKRCTGGEVLCLNGQLGAGKTCFTKGLAKGLGVSETVRSPSFLIAKSYRGRMQLHHIDFYRLSSIADLESFGFEEYFDRDAVVVIEWGEKFLDMLPRPYLTMDFTVAGATLRTIKLSSSEKDESFSELFEALKTQKNK